MSQSILRLYERDYPPIGYLPVEERNQKNTDKKAAGADLQKNGLRVYPNPAIDRVIFDFQDVVRAGRAARSLYMTCQGGLFGRVLRKIMMKALLSGTRQVLNPVCICSAW